MESGRVVVFDDCMLACKTKWLTPYLLKKKLWDFTKWRKTKKPTDDHPERTRIRKQVFSIIPPCLKSSWNKSKLLNVGESRTCTGVKLLNSEKMIQMRGGTKSTVTKLYKYGEIQPIRTSGGMICYKGERGEVELVWEKP